MKKFSILAIAFIAMMQQFSFSQGASISTPQIEDQVNTILNSLSLEEKVGQTCQITLEALLLRDASGKVIEPLKMDPERVREAIVEYGVGSVLNVNWHTLDLETWEDVMTSVHKPFTSNESSVPVIYGIDAIHGANYVRGGTLFPQEIGLAATWNETLAMQFGEVTAYETRAAGIPWNFSPVLDLGRQPLWSRHFETLGEDPYLASKMGKAIICGYQGSNGISREHVASCMKHFVGYSNPVSGRDRTPAWIPEKYMEELYLPPFKAAVEEGALTVMINSGVVNGIPGHMNHHLLTTVLKEEWGFEGFAVSDWEDLIMLHTVHRTAKTIKDGIVQAINAGLDMSMVPLAPQYKEYCSLLKEAVQDGSVSTERLDDAVRRILRVKVILGLYEKNMNQKRAYPKFGSKQHQKLALDAAIESITLLKNDGVLPLKKSQKILVAGPTSNNLMYLNGAWTHTWQGDQSSFNTENRLNIRQAIEGVVGQENCLFSQGAELYNRDGYEASQFVNLQDFEEKANAADVILLCLGEFPSTEKPGDIRSLELNPEQQELAKIAEKTGKPVVLIMVEGRPRIIREIVDDASAVVQTYLPGDFGGDALGKLLFGEENFSGKLPYSYPRYNGQIEFYDHPRSVARHKSNNFNGYNPQWDFGFGMSYSNLQYSNLSLNTDVITENDSIVVSIDITNTGNMDVKEVVQLYVSDHFASIIPTGKSLKAFKKTEVRVKETKTVIFTVSTKDLQFVNAEGKWVVEPGSFSIAIGDQSANFELK